MELLRNWDRSSILQPGFMWVHICTSYECHLFLPFFSSFCPSSKDILGTYTYLLTEMEFFLVLFSLRTVSSTCYDFIFFLLDVTRLINLRLFVAVERAEICISAIMIWDMGPCVRVDSKKKNIYIYRWPGTHLRMLLCRRRMYIGT